MVFDIGLSKTANLDKYIIKVSPMRN